MGTMENIMGSPELTEKFIRMGMMDSVRNKELNAMIEDPPKLHDCILEIQADDGTWHERDESDWLRIVLVHGSHIARVRYKHNV